MLIKGCDDNYATQLDDFGHKSSIQPTVNCFKQTLIGEKFLTDSHLERDKSHTYAHDVAKRVKLDVQRWSLDQKLLSKYDFLCDIRGKMIVLRGIYRRLKLL